MEGISSVFPAHAGMIPPQVIAALNVEGVPRACGDDPCEVAPSTAYLTCSPRMRG